MEGAGENNSAATASKQQSWVTPPAGEGLVAVGRRSGTLQCGHRGKKMGFVPCKLVKDWTKETLSVCPWSFQCHQHFCTWILELSCCFFKESLPHPNLKPTEEKRSQADGDENAILIVCYRLTLCPADSHVETLIPNVTVFGDGAFGR